MPPVPRTSDHLHCEVVSILFLYTHRETTCLTSSGVPSPKTNHDMFRFRYTVFYSQLTAKLGNIFVKTEALCINLNIDGVTLVYLYLPDHTLTPH